MVGTFRRRKCSAMCITISEKIFLRKNRKKKEEDYEILRYQTSAELRKNRNTEREHIQIPT